MPDTPLFECTVVHSHERFFYTASVYSNQSNRPVYFPVVLSLPIQKNTKMVHYKLTYFNLRGKAEIARLILHHAEIPFEDFRLERVEWPQIKSRKFSLIKGGGAYWFNLPFEKFEWISIIIYILSKNVISVYGLGGVSFVWFIC